MPEDPRRPRPLRQVRASCLSENVPRRSSAKRWGAKHRLCRELWARGQILPVAKPGLLAFDLVLYAKQYGAVGRGVAVFFEAFAFSFPVESLGLRTRLPGSRS